MKGAHESDSAKSRDAIGVMYGGGGPGSQTFGRTHFMLLHLIPFLFPNNPHDHPFGSILFYIT